MSKSVPRLYEQFQPEKYNLDLILDAENLSFNGTVNIEGRKVGRPSQRITFHQKRLKISEAKIIKHTKEGDEPTIIERINTQDSYDEIRLHSSTLIYPGKYTITLEFSGTISDAMHGIYPCYFDHDSKKKKLLATQFESHHAREAFPCIDEPEAKAIFDLSLTTPQNDIVLSNMPVSSVSKVDESFKKTTFEPSPIMSAYLLAFVTGEIHSVEEKTKDGILMRTWATVAQPEESIKYANSEAVKLLEFFTDYFQTPFPLIKCDQVALPDFEAGAMENWGLITYREIALLTEPDNRSQTQEQYVSMVVGHEMSHQWFGDLVTMKWWDDLWLNESFASLMEHIALDALHPNWFQWEQYTASDVLASSSRDIYKDVQSVYTSVQHPDEISTLFDPAIVYAKGGRLLKMMREYIGEDAFRAGLKNYFTKHAYKNTVGDDLWTEMSKASNKDVRQFMGPWLTQSGMPLVSVLQTGSIVELKQTRFILDKDDDKQVWPIPLLADKKLGTDILDKASLKIEANNNEPVIINQNGSGHMVVHYAGAQSRKYISSAFKDQSIKPESRINILNDMLLLSRKGEAPLTDSIDIIASAPEEPRDAVWMMMSRILSVAAGLTEGDENTEKNIKLFRQQLASKWYEKLGWDDKTEDSPNTKALRHTILSNMLGGENESAVAEAIDRFKNVSSVTQLPAEQRALIVGTVVRSGQEVIDKLIEEYKSSPNPDVQHSISSGLTHTKDKVVGEYLINKALSENGFVRPQDIFRWYAYLMRNRYTRRDAWAWLKSNWTRLEKLYEDGKSFDHFISYSSHPLNTLEWQKEFEEFFKPKMDNISLKRNIQVALSEIQARVEWRKREEAKIKQYFQ